MFNRSFPKDAHLYFYDLRPEANHAYAFRVAWDEGGYRICVDGTPMTHQDGDLIPSQSGHRPFMHTNVLSLHPGMGAVGILPHEKLAGHKPPTQIPDPHVTYWGHFRIYDLEED